MAQTHELKFENPSFAKRIKGMLGVDFYRLFHTPMFYIFLLISALISGMIVSMTGMAGPDGAATQPLYTNVWNIVAADYPLYIIHDIGEYANMNMVFIFGGIMVSIFIGHDYRSGYAKNIFTVRAQKENYVISKTVVCFIGSGLMFLSYFVGSILGGSIAGLPFDTTGFGIGGVVMSMLSKLFMVAVFVGISLLISVAAKSKTWLSIVGGLMASMLLYTMVPMITPLDSGFLNVIMCLVGGVLFSFGFGVVSKIVLNKTSLV